ncbi:MAG: hypothetical protein AAGJ83_02655, partial [Planctomycetota bacterium]
FFIRDVPDGLFDGPNLANLFLVFQASVVAIGLFVRVRLGCGVTRSGTLDTQLSLSDLMALLAVVALAFAAFQATVTELPNLVRIAVTAASGALSSVTVLLMLAGVLRHPMRPTLVVTSMAVALVPSFVWCLYIAEAFGANARSFRGSEYLICLAGAIVVAAFGSTVAAIYATVLRGNGYRWISTRAAGGAARQRDPRDPSKDAPEEIPPRRQVL